MTPANRLPSDSAAVGQQIVDNAFRFKIEASNFGGALALEYQLEGRLPMSEPGATGKAVTMLRSLLGALEANAERDYPEDD